MINDFQLSEHFNLREFQCSCCGAVRVDSELVAALEMLRDRIGRPILVTSGYRCPAHNRAIGGAIDSDHLYGWAADIVVDGQDPEYVAALAERIPAVARIGTYAGRECVHIGVHERPGLPARWTRV